MTLGIRQAATGSAAGRRSERPSGFLTEPKLEAGEESGRGRRREQSWCQHPLAGARVEQQEHRLKLSGLNE